MADEKSTSEATGREKTMKMKIDPKNILSEIAPELERLRVNFPTEMIAPPTPRPGRRLPTIPGAPQANPFKELPYPSPGERIKADDFKRLSQGLEIIYDTFALSGALFGRNFGEVKSILSSQHYAIHRVMSVFGTEIDNLDDESLDNRKVIQIVPVELGEQRVIVILAEAVETRRFAPNLLGLTYKEASERLRAVLGDVTFPGAPMTAFQLVGLSLAEAKEVLSK